MGYNNVITQNKKSKMEFRRKTIKLGNSSGVLLPKRILGSEVKVIVVKRPINIKKITIKELSKYFQDILGIYILSKKPAEVLAISNNLRETINKNKLKISIVPLKIIKEAIKKSPKLKQKIEKAEVILNENLLGELREINYDKKI